MKRYTYTTDNYSIELTPMQAVKLLQDAKKAGYSMELCYTHYWQNRELDYSGSSGGFFFRKSDSHFMIFREAYEGF